MELPLTANSLPFPLSFSLSPSFSFPFLFLLSFSLFILFNSIILFHPMLQFASAGFSCGFDNDIIAPESSSQRIKAKQHEKEKSITTKCHLKHFPFESRYRCRHFPKLANCLPSLRQSLPAGSWLNLIHP